NSFVVTLVLPKGSIVGGSFRSVRRNVPPRWTPPAGVSVAAAVPVAVAVAAPPPAVVLVASGSSSPLPHPMRAAPARPKPATPAPRKALRREKRRLAVRVQ